jgi:hypothetical protein
MDGEGLLNLVVLWEREKERGNGNGNGNGKWKRTEEQKRNNANRTKRGRERDCCGHSFFRQLYKYVNVCFLCLPIGGGKYLFKFFLYILIIFVKFCQQKFIIINYKNLMDTTTIFVLVLIFGFFGWSPTNSSSTVFLLRIEFKFFQMICTKKIH